MSRLGLRFAAKSLGMCWRADIEDHVISLKWSLDGNTLAAAGISGPITLFGASDGRARHRLAGHDFGTTALDLNLEGTLLASSGQDGKVRLWDVASGEQRAELEGGAAWVERVTWSTCGNLLASAAGRTIRVWDEARLLLRDYRESRSTVSDIQWKPCELVLASAAYGGTTLWEPDQADAMRHFAWQGSTLALAWSPDGKYLATGDQDSTVHFWITRTGEDLQMWGYPTKVRELAWDRTSRYLATGGSPTVTVWDCSGKRPQGTKPTELRAHEDLVRSLAYQRGGPLLASGGADGLIVVWTQKSQVAAAKLDAAVTQVAWSPDGRRLAASSEQGVIEVFYAS